MRSAGIKTQPYIAFFDRMNVIGQLDDLLVLFFGMKLLRGLTPLQVLAKCETRAKGPIFSPRRVIG